MLTLERRFEFVIDTLIMISPDFSSLDFEVIDDYLKELEGDYISFLDINCVGILAEYNIISDLHKNEIVNLKAMIASIPSKLWNVKDFMEDNQWQNVRKISEDILKSLNIKKRIVM